MNPHGEADGPVFVVGMNGSGKVVLNECLNQHPNIFGFPGETKILPYFIQNCSKYGPLEDDRNWQRLFEDLRCSYAFTKANGGSAPGSSDDWREIPRDVGAAFDGIMHGFAQEERKVRWAEKSPLHALHILSLAEVFPKARFLHIVRDARDVVASLHRRWRSSPYVTVYRWKHLVREADKQGSQIPERYLRLRYEQLATNPAAELERICEFLGEEFCAQMLHTGDRVGDRSMPRSFEKRLRPNSNKYRTYFTEKTVAGMERIAGKELSCRGYEVDDLGGDWDPTRLQLAFWRGRDLTLYHLRKGLRYWRNRNFRNWFGRKSRAAIRDSLRQSWTNRSR